MKQNISINFGNFRYFVDVVGHVAGSFFLIISESYLPWWLAAENARIDCYFALLQCIPDMVLLAADFNMSCEIMQIKIKWDLEELQHLSDLSLMYFIESCDIYNKEEKKND